MIHGSGRRGADQKNKFPGYEKRVIRVVFSSPVTVPVELSADYYSMFTVTQSWEVPVEGERERQK